MKNNYYAVILAGGVGTRFWPISTQQFPKQFHDMLGTGTTLIQKTYSRFKNLIPSKNILIATNKKYEKLVLEQLPKTTKKQLLLEPAMRNTAPCVLYSAFKIYNENPDGIMIVTPSDHWIENEKEFLKNIQTSFDFCAENDALITLGIKPSSPNTGYGYIQFNHSEKNIKKASNFTEKPNLETAIQFIEEENYLWNAGIFAWSVKSILKTFKMNLPEMYSIFEKGNDYYNTSSESNFIEENYASSQNISIDFGIMEKASNVHVLPVDFGWNDLGTWGSLYNKLTKDKNQNATVGGSVIYRNAKNNIVKTQSKKRVVIQGLENYIVVEKDNVLLICPKNQEQEIKQITSAIETEFGNEFV
jgi:mannose-1-phosphate guanylyltransferase